MKLEEKGIPKETRQAHHRRKDNLFSGRSRPFKRGSYKRYQLQNMSCFGYFLDYHGYSIALILYFTYEPASPLSPYYVPLGLLD